MDEPDDHQGDYKSSGWNRLRGKLFSPSHESFKRGGNKPLNDNLEEFLKPIVPPKTDIDLKSNASKAQRWPDAEAVRAAQDIVDAGQVKLKDGYQFRKPRRRLGLKVDFLDAAPEIIGEGGDEADRPVVEISRVRDYAPARVPTAIISGTGANSALRRKDFDSLAKWRYGLDKDVLLDAGHQQLLPSAQGFVHASQDERGDQFLRQRKEITTSEYLPQQQQRRRAPTGYSYERSLSIDPNVANKPHDRHALQIDLKINDVRQSQQQERELPAHRPNDSKNSPERHSHDLLSDKGIVPRTSSFTRNELHRMGADEGRALTLAADNLTPSLEKDALQSSSRTSKIQASPSFPLSKHENDRSLPYRGRAFASHTLISERPMDPSSETHDTASFQVVTQNLDYDSNLGISKGSPSPTSPAQTLSLIQPTPTISDIYESLQRQSLHSLQTPPNPGQEFSTRPHSSSFVTPIHTSAHFRPLDEIQAANPLPARTADTEIGAKPQNAALLDFADRVSRLWPNFRFASSVEKPLNQYSEEALLRAALWWFLKGRSGLEDFVKVQQRKNERIEDRSLLGQERSALLQHHTNLAKAWWIISEARDLGKNLPMNANTISRTISVMLDSFGKVVESLERKSMMPPRDFVLQDLDTAIWIQYPSLPPHTYQSLSMNVVGSDFVDGNAVESNALLAMPLGDTLETFCYDQIFVDVVVLTSNDSHDHIILPSVLSIIRNRNDLQLQLILASLSPLLNVTISDTSARSLVSWNHVRWKREVCAMRVELPSKMMLQVNLDKKNYETLESQIVQTQRMISSSQPKENELLLLEDQLRGFQYWDTDKTKNFPTDYLTFCTVYLFETFATESEGVGRRQLHKGYRLTIFMSCREKRMRSVSMELGRYAPLEYDFGSAREDVHKSAIQLSVHTEGRRRSVYLTFKTQEKRDTFRGCATGATVGPTEAVTLTLILKALVFQTEAGIEEVAFSTSPSMGETRLQVLTHSIDDADKQLRRTPYSGSGRIVILNSRGSIVDRFNLGRGELQINLDGDDQLKILRRPRKDLTISLGPNRVDDSFTQSMRRIHDMVAIVPTIQTYKFNSVHDLHAFQLAVTGFEVLFDGVTCHFAISRRRMVVPIYKSYEAHRARIQIVQRDGVVQLLAFFEDYSLAKCMNFQLKNTDTFETLENKAGQFCIKLVDAKFALKKEEEDGDESGMFVCLDVLEYPGEHEDITVGFEMEQVRDEFAAALPAAPTVPRRFTLKRRI